MTMTRASVLSLRSVDAVGSCTWRWLSESVPLKIVWKSPVPSRTASLEALRALLAQPVLHRGQHHQRDGAERDRARGEQGEQQPPAQAGRQPPSHGSRKR